MFQISDAIEDQVKIDLMKKYELNNQAVYAVNPFHANEVNNELSQLMCKRKLEEYQKRVYMMDTEGRKLPTDAVGFDCIHLVSMIQYQQIKHDREALEEITIKGRIEHIFGKTIVFSIMNPRTENQIENGRRYHVSFLPNRVVARVVQHALKSAMDNEMQDFLFNFEDPMTVEKDDNFTNFNWMNPSIATNEEQQIAIQNIVNCSSYPSPYIIYGPPGTGKTTTIVEAIAQVLHHKPNSNILVTVGSNSSCDDIAVRLMKYVSLNKMLRLYSPVYASKPEKINPKLEKFSNFRGRKECLYCKLRSCLGNNPATDPTFEEFCTAKIIICTLISCGRVIKAGIEANHFDYIFVDEAACQSESNTLVPIVGLGVSKEGTHSQIVLSGDHKQLGPIVTHNMAIQLDKGKSMMERIIETIDGYKHFDQNYIMQLVQNYRSHPAIIDFSNRQFYDETLRFCCPENVCNYAIGWHQLPNEYFPVLFHNNELGQEDPVGISLKNVQEAKIVEKYVKDLLRNGINGQRVSPKHIGVVTGYNGQKALLRSFLRDFPKVDVDSIDGFQVSFYY
jgi:helicase MOV-10